MRRIKGLSWLSFCLVFFMVWPQPGWSKKLPPTSVYLENLTWLEAEKVLKEYEVVMVALGVTGKGHYSPTGIWGDPTLATREKGKIIVEATIDQAVKEIKELISLEVKK